MLKVVSGYQPGPGLRVESRDWRPETRDPRPEYESIVQRTSLSYAQTSRSARVTRGGMNAGDLPVEIRAEGTGKSLLKCLNGYSLDRARAQLDRDPRRFQAPARPQR